jgi:pimeloyl-ACP methyl ester carboxylesterase
MRGAKHLVLAGAGLALIAACTPAATTPSPTAEPAAAAFVADLAVEGERTLHIVCVGPADTGRPTVVFENGGGPTLSTWSAQLEDIGATHRACAYDRAGIGTSDAAPGPRTTRDQVNDLATLLEAAGVTGPIVLVAHSAGGWNAIVYTAVHPEQVVGAVLVDITPRGLEGRWLEELPPETPDEPEAIHQAREDFTTFLTDPSRNPEAIHTADSLEQVLAAPGFGDRPTEILWATASQATVWPGFPPDLAARLNAALEDLRVDVEGLAEDPKVTRVDTDHFIHEERPDVVNAAIRRVLDQLEP